MMLSVAMVCGSLTSAARSRCETLICNTACDRDEVALASVGDIVRSSFPCTIMSMTSCTFLGWWLERPITDTAWFESSRRFKPPLTVPPAGQSKSRIVSLYISRYESEISETFSSEQSAIRSNNSCIVRKMMPGCWTVPVMVCVLPQPVAP